MIDFYASAPHYFQHLAPIWNALPPEHRGTFRASSDCNVLADRWGVPVLNTYAERGASPDDVLVVAGHRDQRGARYSRIVLANHGAGQTYSDSRDSEGYVGGRHRDHFALLLEPNEACAAQAPAGVRAEVVGVPFLDRWHKIAREGDGNGSGRVRGEASDSRPVVALTWHWDCTVSVESGTAFWVYRDVLPWAVLHLLAEGVDVIGTCHPRWDTEFMRREYALAGIEWVPSWADVLDRADLLVADNTSGAPEFASTGRPVLWVNHPNWRKDVEHGGRFWDWPRGQVTCDHPENLWAAVMLAMADPPDVARARHTMVESIYPLRDGRAAERAAAAILSL